MLLLTVSPFSSLLCPLGHTLLRGFNTLDLDFFLLVHNFMLQTIFLYKVHCISQTMIIHPFCYPKVTFVQLLSLYFFSNCPLMDIHGAPVYQPMFTPTRSLLSILTCKSFTPQHHRTAEIIHSCRAQLLVMSASTKTINDNYSTQLYEGKQNSNIDNSHLVIKQLLLQLSKLNLNSERKHTRQHKSDSHKHADACAAH